ncbi:MAG: cryptochrome/photolyase family protein [Nanobdellota archaeon]
MIIHIFRRDLRIYDNTSLRKALEKDSVIPCFILDPGQRDHDFFSDNAFSFMIDSLEGLDNSLKRKKSRLHLFSGRADEVVEDIIKKTGAEAVYVNKDYTPFSIKRDKEIKEKCREAGVEFKVHDDCLLNKPEDTLKKDGSPYTVFTPFYKKAKDIEVREPADVRGNLSYMKGLGNSKFPKIKKNKFSAEGGREKGLELLKNIEGYKNYRYIRDIPARDHTTRLAPHLKFGTVSAREVYHFLRDNLDEESLIRQLYWRDFYTQIAYFFPHVFGDPFRKKYRNVRWDYDKKKFRQWCEGKTGFPIVDAGMRQLNRTGYMHNRVRMIVASFLTKHLHIDWRWGEKYFAQKLTDYDPAVNNGSWQWAASTGCDAQPFFRVFNPWRQQLRFDKDCEYIKRWVPELSDKNKTEINNPESSFDDYPRPIVDHKTEREEAIARFKEI